MKNIPRLPDAELEVMQAVWECPPPAERQAIEEKLKRSQPMAPTTVLTLLSRLAEKGFLQAEKKGRRAQYTPLVSREEYGAQQSRHFVNQVFQGSMPAFAAALCSSGLSKEEIAELRALLEADAL